MAENKLYYGDNLDVLRRYVKDETVDLVYLDPPFKSQQDYNVIFKEKNGAKSASQITAFEDTWEWDAESKSTYEDLVERGDDVSDVMRAFYTFLGGSDMMAYLSMMAPRVIELHRVLKHSGSIYLHCDPTASHYLKLLMDAVFGPEHFRNEITWKRTNTHSDAKRWSPVSDTLLYYSKNNSPTWNPPLLPHSDEHIASKYRNEDELGRYTLSDMTSPKPRPNMMYEWKGFPSPPLGWRYSKETMARLDVEGRIWYPPDKSKRPRLKRYLKKMAGVLMGNVWVDISPLNSQAQERLGYPTQKPEALLERIIRASSNEGDLIVDPFCGCGTAVAAAHKLNRRWIGIDITHLAIGLIKTRLHDAFGPTVKDTYDVIGEPTDLPSARVLAKQDRFQFQAWALGLVDARRASSSRKGADHGIDGKLFFRDGREELRQIIMSVKSGGVQVGDVRDLVGTIDREKADIGVLITLEEPSKHMTKEAVDAGFFKSPNFDGKVPRIQILTIEELLDGRRIEIPHLQQETFKQAPKAKRATATTMTLPLEAEEPF
jgi:site-specific DNA-methyltransferase (adenine-specific)